ncbi:glutaminase [Pseudoruegeria sp. SK021]|uniref:glutaminase n=1 Tax=Pseudoruegeria sp. SK021 TaxID=1933035 RepID=UPI000A25D5B3|nr:glutaminase [Pseudoruegeria sp. SK021]OSP56295.1 glutaminase [Pseudoruegeria sp. SK021]
MTADELQPFLTGLAQRVMREDDWGTQADYIPDLAGIDPVQFAISVVLPDGQVLSAGASEQPFSIQSISKIFTLSIALGRIGDSIWARVGREPSGDAFNSIVLLENEQGHPRNPFINAGAIVTTDALLAGRAPREALSEILQFIRMAAGDESIHINRHVARSEKATGHRNMALAHYLRSFDNLTHEPDLTLGTYFHQCSIEMSTRQLALAGRYLAALPCSPRMISDAKVRRLNALMLTCGQYDGSGEFAFRVGLPSKSGVGGGLLIVAPGKASIAIWSPGLNEHGNSQAGTRAAAHLSDFTGWSVFRP